MTGCILHFTTYLYPLATVAALILKNDILSVSKELMIISQWVILVQSNLFKKYFIDISCMLSAGTEDEWKVLFISFEA